MTASENVSLISNEEITINFGQSESPTDDKIKSLTWDESVYTLQSAVLTLNATQTYQTGAEAHIAINGQDVAVLHWNLLETENIKKSIDVTGILSNGDNKISMLYKLATAALSDQTLTVSATILMTFIGQNTTGKAPVNEGNTRSGNFWRDLGTKVKSWLWLIVVLLIVVLVLYFVLKAVFKGGGIGAIRNQVKEAVESIIRH